MGRSRYSRADSFSGLQSDGEFLDVVEVGFAEGHVEAAVEFGRPGFLDEGQRLKCA